MNLSEAQDHFDDNQLDNWSPNKKSNNLGSPPTKKHINNNDHLDGIQLFKVEEASLNMGSPLHHLSPSLLNDTADSYQF